MASAPQVTFDPVAWSDRVAGDLTRIADVRGRELEIFQQRVEAGDFMAMEALHKGKRVGSVIWSVEDEADGKAIVINAAAAEPVDGVCVVKELHVRMIGLAVMINARALRCWTQRAGLVRKLENLGATRRYVMEIEL